MIVAAIRLILLSGTDELGCAVHYSMIPKSGYRFSEKIMLKQ